MREETRKRLNRLSQLEISAWFPALAIVIVVFMGLFAFRTTVRAEREVSGVVQRAVWRINDDTGQRYPDIHVILDNDALVRVGSVAPSLPDIGDRVKDPELVPVHDDITLHNGCPDALAVYYATNEHGESEDFGKIALKVSIFDLYCLKRSHLQGGAHGYAIRQPERPF